MLHHTSEWRRRQMLKHDITSDIYCDINNDISAYKLSAKIKSF